MTRAHLVAATLAISLVSVHARPHQDAAQSAGSSTVVYALAVDDKNAPVTDLTPADFVVKEDGKTRQILSAEPATARLQIAVLVDDNGTGIFRYGVGQFAQRLQGRADISLRVVTEQVRTITDFTDNVQDWINGIAQLGVRPSTPEGGQLLEGVSEASLALKKREASRPVILALTVGGEEHSTLQAKHVLDQLHESRAALYVLFAGNSAVRSASAAARPSELLDSNHNLDQVLGEGPKQSGGRRKDVIATQALLTDLQQIAGDLNAQYAIKYVRPADRNAPQKLQVSVQRKGVNVFAPTRAPLR